MVTTTTGLATSFIQFSRPGATGGGATVTDSDGKIKWAGHNLLLQSESFDISSPGWGSGGGGTTVNANKYVAPNGTTTADEVVASGANASRSQTVSLTAADYKLRFWVRAGASDTFRFGLNNGSWLASSSVIISGSGSVSGSGLTTVSGLDNNWTLVELSATATTASTSVFLYPGPSTQSAGNSIGIWGAHLYRSDLGGMVLNPARGDAYYPTTPRNLLGFTEDFSNAAWSKVGSTVVSANQTVAPNGLNTADLVDEGTGTGYHHCAQSVTTVASNTYTLSFYAKSVSLRWVNVSIYSNGNTTSYGAATFDLLNGVVGTSAASGTGYAIVGSPAITSVGNGWYRCSLTVTNGSSLAAGFFAISPSNVSTIGSYGLNSYTGTGQTFYLWGAQLSDSASLDAYSPVYGAAVTSAAYYAPRLDFNANGSALGLLVEELRTNVVATSNDYTVAGWNKSGVGTGIAPVVTPNDAIAPDGTLTAQRVAFNRGAGNTTGDQSVLSHSISGYTASREYTGSVYIKAATAGDVGKQVGFRHVAGGAYGIITLTASWQRFTLVETSFSTSSTIDFASRGSITADNTVSAHIWGVSVEVGASNAATPFATSLIPTNGAQVTRTADVASVSTQAFPYSASEGTVVASFDYLGGSAVLANNQITASLRVSSGNLIYLYNGNGVATGYCAVGGADQAFLTRNAVAANVQTKLAFAFKANDFAASQDGGAIASDTSGSLPSAAPELTIGSSGTNSAHLNGHIRQITYLPRRISNAELQTRTA